MSFEKLAKKLASTVVQTTDWKLDCCGKQDFDGELVSLSCRYYPDHTAYANILLYFAGDYITLARAELEGETEADIKRKVEEWAAREIERVYMTMLNEYRFQINAADAKRFDKLLGN